MKRIKINTREPGLHYEVDLDTELPFALDYKLRAMMPGWGVKQDLYRPVENRIQSVALITRIRTNADLEDPSVWSLFNNADCFLPCVRGQDVHRL